MKKILLTLIASVVITSTVFTQTSGDYRSIANGNWNDPTKWETFDGSNWVSATTYPGQDPGTGTVTIKGETTILITANVPNPITNLTVDADYYYYYIGENYYEYYVYGYLTFSAESAVSLIVSRNVWKEGELSVANQIGAKVHMLSIGGSLWTYGPFYTVDGDDKLGVTFNTTEPNSTIQAFGTYFGDITFNGIGITVTSLIRILGTATFINGVVSAGDNDFSSESLIFFEDGATVTGASNTSFVDGVVYKKGDDSFTFPIGDEGVYSPLAISAPVGQQEVFGASYRHSNGLAWVAISDPGLYSISDCEFWTLQNVNSNITSYPLGVTVGWTSSSGCGSSPYITNVSEVTLARINSSGTWDSHGGVGTGTATNGSVTWGGMTNLGAFTNFTLGNLNASCIPPSGLNTTNIGLHSATISWSAITGSISYDVAYRASSYAWINAATGITTTSVNLSGLNPSTIYEWKVRTNCSSGSSFYRQTQFTTLPCGTPSGLSTSNISAGSATLSWNAVSNATNYNVEYKQSTAVDWIAVPGGVNSLTYNLEGLSASTEYAWRVQAICSRPPYGDYTPASFITLTCDNAYEPNNSSNDAKTIALGTTIYAGISSFTDVDWFKLTIPGNANAVLTIMLNNLPADYDLYVYNKNLVLVGSSTNSGISNDAVSFNSHGKNAIYYIKIVGKNGAYSISQCYNLLAEVSGTARPVTNASTPQKEIGEGLNKQLLYPNPASEFVYLNFNSATEGLVNIQIVNSIGQLVKQHPVNVIKGYNQFKIQVADIRPGMYILRINKGALNITRKFVIER